MDREILEVERTKTCAVISTLHVHSILVNKISPQNILNEKTSLNVLKFVI